MRTRNATQIEPLCERVEDLIVLEVCAAVSAEPAASAGPEMLAASLFRHESGRLVAALTRLFGPRNLQLAEDVVQEALECACSGSGEAARLEFNVG